VSVAVADALGSIAAPGVSVTTSTCGSCAEVSSKHEAAPDTQVVRPPSAVASSEAGSIVPVTKTGVFPSSPTDQAWSSEKPGDAGRRTTSCVQTMLAVPETVGSMPFVRAIASDSAGAVLPSRVT
jgi:hypothetical protein